MKIGNVISALTFAESEKARISKLVQQNGSCNKKIFYKYAENTKTVHDLKIPGQSKGRPAHIKAAVKKIIEGLEGTKKEKERFWKVYHSTIVYYLENYQIRIQKLLLEVDYDNPDASSEDLLRVICENAKKYKVTSEVVEELYNLWGFERVENIEDILTLIENDDSSETEVETEESEAQEFPEGLPDRYNGDDTVKKRLKLFLNTSTGKINKLFNSNFLKGHFKKHRALRKGNTLRGLHSLYSIPDFRRDTYEIILVSVCDKGEESLGKLIVSSYEYESFRKYKKNIGSQGKFNENLLKDICELDSKIKIHIKEKYEKLDACEIEGLKNIFQNHLLVWKDVKKDLKKWSKKNDEEKEIIANVIFSLGTLMDSIAPIQIAIKTVPEIKYHFSDLMCAYDEKISSAKKSNDVIDTDEISQDQIGGQVTWENSVSDLMEVAKNISNKKPNKDHLSQLAKIYDNLLKTFPAKEDDEEEEKNVSLDEIKNLLREYKNELLVFGKERNYSWLNQEMLDQIFKKWKTYVADVEVEQYKKIISKVKQSKVESFNQLEKYSEHEQEKNELDNKIQKKEPDASIEIEARQVIKKLRKELHAKEEILEGIEIEFIQQTSPPKKTHIIHNSTILEDSDLNSEKQEEISEQKLEPADPLEAKEKSGMTSENDFAGESDVGDEVRLKTTNKDTKGKSVGSSGEAFGTAKILNFNVTGKQATEGFLNGGDDDEIHQKNAFWYMVKEGQLNYAYWFVKSLEDSKKSKIIIPSILIKAIALADKVFDPLEEADFLYKENLVDIKKSETRIRSLVSRDSGFEESRYLVLSGFLQPSFVGHHHPNLEMMDLSNKNIPKIAVACFESCFNFVRQKKSNFSFLQFRGTGKSEKELIKEHKENIGKFVHACSNKSGTWQEKIFVSELIEGEFKPLIKILEKDLRERWYEVQKIIDKYPNRDTLVNLLKSNHQIKKIYRDNPHHIYDYRKVHLGNAVSKCQQLLKLAKMWIRLVTLKTKSQNEKDLVKVFSSNFKNNYSKAREELIRLRDTHNDLVQYSCINLCVEHLGNLSEAINGERQSLGFSINDWFELPQRLESSKSNTSSASLALSLATIAAKNFNLQEALNNSIGEGDFAVAEVLLREQRKAGPSRKEINEFELNIRRKRDDFKKKLEDEVEVIKSLVDDAYEHSIIDEETRLSFYSEIDGASEIGNEENPRHPKANGILESIENKVGSKKEDTLKDWKGKFKKLREGLNSREELRDRSREIKNYEESIENAFKDKNITVVSEKLISYEEFSRDPNQPLYDSEKYRLAEFEEFLNKQEDIFSECKNLNPNQIKDYILHSRFKFLDFSDHTKKPISEVKAWSGLSSTQISGKLNAGQKDQVCQILNRLGLSEISPDSIKDVSYGPKINLIQAEVKIPKGESPFPIFGSRSKGQYYFVISQKNSYSEIHSFLKDRDIYSENSPIIVLVMDDFDSTLRSQFTEYSLKNKLSIIVIDRILFLFVLSLADDPTESRLKKFFKVTLPFTYSNPYQIKGGAPPTEMIFGREKEINELIDIPGVAIIFGGRQLGKSTLLKEAETRFHNPENGQFFMSGPSLKHYRGKDLKYIRNDFWKKIGDQFCAKGLLEKKETYQFEDIVNFLKERDDLTVLFSFDEMDDFLIEDDKHGFPICSDLKQMISDTGERFKVLMAGLLSVQRFSGRPNVPLAQLGVARNIGMLDKRDAMELIQVPSAFAGYSFDDASVNTILAYTNRHPGLIQVFCFYLLEYLRLQRINKRAVTKMYKITQVDISAIRRKPDISDAIKSRFQMTIDLHDHWKVLIYAVIVEGIELGFDPSQAKKAGEFWWKEGFSGKDTALVKILLDEMVGLGVLSRKEGKDRIYSLRSPNILPHLGSRKEIEDTLEDFKPLTSRDQSYNHRLSQSGQLSPFEESHELVITGHTKLQSNSEQRNEDRFTKFTITGIFGSDALGFKELKNSFSTLSEFEGSKDYTVLEYSKIDSSGTKECLKWIKQKIKESTKNKSIVMMIHMPSMPEYGELYPDLISEVERSFANESIKNNTRLVFLFNPEATWNWLGLENCREFEEKISFITLRTFSEDAIEKLLKDLKLLFDTKSKNLVIKRTDGWFELIKKFLEVKNKSGGGNDLKLFRGLDNHLPETPQPDDAMNFLKKQGLGLETLPFAIPLLNSIIKNSNSGAQIEIQSDLLDDCIEYYNIEKKLEEQLDSDRVREWYSRMGILKIKPDEKNKNNHMLCVDKKTKACVEVLETP